MGLGVPSDTASDNTKWEVIAYANGRTYYRKKDNGLNARVYRSEKTGRFERSRRRLTESAVEKMVKRLEEAKKADAEAKRQREREETQKRLRAQNAPRYVPLRPGAARRAYTRAHPTNFRNK